MTTSYTYRDQMDALTENIAAAHRWTHPSYALSTDDLTLERRSRVNAATAARTELLDQARRDVFPAAARTLNALVEQYENPPTRDAGQVADRRNRWDRIAMLAERGVTLGDIIASASKPDLDAIAEWAPTWVRAEKLDGYGGELAMNYHNSPVAWIHDGITSRYAALDPNGPASKAITKVRDALDVSFTMSHPDAMTLAVARDQLDTMSDRVAMLTYRVDTLVATYTDPAAASSLLLRSTSSGEAAMAADRAGQDQGHTEVGQ